MTTGRELVLITSNKQNMGYFTSRVFPCSVICEFSLSCGCGYSACACLEQVKNNCVFNLPIKSTFIACNYRKLLPKVHLLLLPYFSVIVYNYYGVSLVLLWVELGFYLI